MPRRYKSIEIDLHEKVLHNSNSRGHKRPRYCCRLAFLRSPAKKKKKDPGDLARLRRQTASWLSCGFNQKIFVVGFLLARENQGERTGEEGGKATLRPNAFDINDLSKSGQGQLFKNCRKKLLPLPQSPLLDFRAPKQTSGRVRSQEKTRRNCTRRKYGDTDKDLGDFTSKNTLEIKITCFLF